MRRLGSERLGMRKNISDELSAALMGLTEHSVARCMHEEAAKEKPSVLEEEQAAEAEQNRILTPYDH